MSLDEQRDMIERALGERMLNHCYAILHSWAQELGDTRYADRIQSLEQNYDSLFRYYLNADDLQREEIQNEMTLATYRLVDDMFADVRIKRGIAPDMHGFNPENIESVIRYFSSCVHIQDEDYEWLMNTANTDGARSVALVALSALAQNVRLAFSEMAVSALIDLMDNDHLIIRDQALAQLLMILTQYDIRIDYYPHLQDRFVEAIGDGEGAMQTVCNLIRSSSTPLSEAVEKEAFKKENLPEELRELLGEGQLDDNQINEIVSSAPASENQYFDELITLFPNTWLCGVLVGEDEYRQQMLRASYIAAGRMDLSWDDIDEAEQWIITRLRDGHPTYRDYINYAHICFLRGDRLMAYENYMEARRMVGSAKKFFKVFRPDRNYLSERGIPLEQIYLMEDNLIRSH